VEEPRVAVLETNLDNEPPLEVEPVVQAPAVEMPLTLPVISEESDLEVAAPELEEPSPKAPVSLSDSLIGSMDLPPGEPLSEPDTKSNSLKPIDTPPPPYSSLPRSPKSDDLSPPAPAEDEIAVLLAENAVLAESPLPLEASAPVVASPHHTPPPASPTNETKSAAKPPKAPGPPPPKN